MSPYIRELSKETGMSENDIKPVWKKAKEITIDTFGKPEEEFSKKEFRYTLETAKKLLGLDESILDPTAFLKSESSAKEFIDSLVEVQVSGDFGIDKTLNPPEEETPEDEEMPDTTDRADDVGDPPDTDVVKQEGVEIEIEIDSEEDEDEEEETPSPDATDFDESAAANLDDLIDKQENL